MMSEAFRLPVSMTVDEFQAWDPPYGTRHLRWQLVDGQPVAMNPPSPDHCLIHSECSRLLGNHLADRLPCRVLTGAGVVPGIQALTNERVPELAVTCSEQRPPRGVPDPVLLIEILSPSNAAQTRANVWAYTTIPSVREIVLFHSLRVEAEILCRDEDGSWPREPTMVGAEGMLDLNSIGFSAPLSAFYRTTSLVQ
jgi:Uma2 family endonuclease